MATLICTWGGNADTSYATVAEAKEYIGDENTIGYKNDPSPWTALTVIQQQRALLSATRDIDNGANYIGDRQFIDQTLEFPRLPDGETRWPWTNRSLTDSNTFNIYLTEQKRRVKQATIEQAFALVRDGERDEHTERRLRGIRSFSESIGPISESASYGGPVLPLCPEAMRLLGPYLGYPELVRR